MIASYGMTKDDIDTPALLIDLDVFESNLKKMSLPFLSATAKLRPHAKTHKTPIIAHRQMTQGACGITCSKLGEAESLIFAGIKDILIANQIVGKPKLNRLASLAKQAKITVAVDNEYNIDQLSDSASTYNANIGILVEIDVGMGRCGVRSLNEAIRLAKRIDKEEYLNFEGLQGYEGHCVFIKDEAERERQTNLAYQLLDESRKVLEQIGFQVKTVSGGGTGTFSQALKAGILTEIQAGSYVFMDGHYNEIPGLGFGNALMVLSTVISRPEKKRLVTDCGLKSISVDFGLPVVKNMKELQCIKAAEEHTLFDTTVLSNEIKIGDKIELIPSHCCTTVNLHDFYYGIRNGMVEAIWPIAARGKFF